VALAVRPVGSFMLASHCLLRTPVKKKLPPAASCAPAITLHWFALPAAPACLPRTLLPRGCSSYNYLFFDAGTVAASFLYIQHTRRATICATWITKRVCWLVAATNTPPPQLKQQQVYTWIDDICGRWFVQRDD